MYSSHPNCDKDDESSHGGSSRLRRDSSTHSTPPRLYNTNCLPYRPRKRVRASTAERGERLSSQMMMVYRVMFVELLVLLMLLNFSCTTPPMDITSTRHANKSCLLVAVFSVPVGAVGKTRGKGRRRQVSRILAGSRSSSFLSST